MKKTFKKAAREYAYSVINSFGRNGVPNGISDIKEMLAIAFENGSEWHAKQSLWISAKERLPEEDGYYFVTDGDVVEKIYFFKRWNKFASTIDYPHLFYDEGVIKAWLPIPSFDEILEANKDVLERIKEKGD